METADASTRSTAIKITGNALDNVIIGTKVADTLNGGAGSDTLTGGKGANIFVYTGGHDVIRDYTTADKISIGGGLTYKNHYVNGKNLVGITTVNGKNSSVNVYTNEIKLNKDSTAITLSSAADDFSASGYTKLATIDGSNTYDVKIVGNKLANKIIGGLTIGNGKDTLVGGKGNDILTGGKGNDLFVYESGNDYITDCAAGEF